MKENNIDSDCNGDLIWRNVTIWAEDSSQKTKWSWLPFSKRPEKVILNDVSGYASKGSLVAVLGPSGSGKTTLLSHLSGRSRLRSSGTVTLNGYSESARRALGILVPQHDLFFDTLTVAEHLYFMTEMKLNKHTSPVEKRLKLEYLTRELKLTDHSDKLIDCLSGGEKKALSMATALISDPQMMFCDEPTTGLDTYNAMLVVDLLKHLAASGKIVMCSIHQPSSHIFHQFNEVMLIAEGVSVFHGGLQDCLHFFDRFGYQCPNNFNPAEFYLKHLTKSDSKETVSSLARSFRNSEYFSNFTDAQITSINENVNSKIAPWCTQFRLLLWRSWKYSNRLLGYQLFAMLMTVAAGVLICFSAWGVSATTQRGVQDMCGLLWLACSEVAFTSAWSVMDDFSYDMAIYKRECELYSSSAFYLSKFLIMLPRFFIFPYAYLAVLFIGVEFPSPLMSFLTIGFIIAITSIASGSYGLMVTAQFSSTGIISDIVVPIDLIAFLLAGVFINIKTFPLWMSILKYASHFFYGIEAVYIIFWSQIKNIECPEDKTLPCMKSGEEVLSYYGFASSDLVYDFVGLLAITIIMTFLGIWALKREGLKGDVAY